MKFIKYFFYCWIVFILACHPEEEIITDSPDAGLLLSTDTVLFDTLLTERLSLTKRFRIYNPSENAVRIDRIRLGLGGQSSYRIIANGKEGPEITNEILSGGDSLLVLVDSEINPNDQDLPYLVKDSVIIDWNTNSLHVKLIAWGQDAHYINAAALFDTTFSGSRPFVIYDSLLVQPGCTLKIEKGVRMLFNNDAALHVAGTLIISGEKDARVTFRNTRFDQNYLEAPGQWGDPQIGAGIIYYPQSQGNVLSYCVIENAASGIYMGVPDEDDEFDLAINNTIIRHMTRFGIIAFTSDIKAENSLIDNCGSSLVANLAGGNYEYIHCTLSNYPNFFLSEDPAVILSDNIETGGDPIIAPLKISLINNIIWGSGDEELIINGGGGSEINLIMESNIVRSEGTIPDNYTSTETNFPDFENPLSFNYRLDSTSFPVDKGRDAGLLMDLDGKTRDSFPDIGAYEYIEE